LYSVRTPAPSARTCSTGSAPRAFSSSGSTIAWRGGRYRIASGVCAASRFAADFADHSERARRVVAPDLGDLGQGLAGLDQRVARDPVSAFGAVLR
jgi:hypothetical protein